MLDGVGPCPQRSVDALGAVGVDRDAHAEHVRLLDQRVHLGLTVLLAADAVGLGEDTAGAAKLDDLGTVLAQLADHGADLVRAVGDGRRVDMDVGRELGGIAMPAGRANRIGRGHDARAGDVAVLDRLLQPDIGIAVAADVADRREAGFEGLLRMGDADRSPEARRVFQRVIPADGRVAGQVDVHVDQAGEQCQRAEIDALGPRRDRHARRRTGCGDAAVDDHDSGVVDGLARSHVDHMRGGNHDRLGIGGGAGEQTECKRVAQEVQGGVPQRHSGEGRNAATFKARTLECNWVPGFAGMTDWGKRRLIPLRSPPRRGCSPPARHSPAQCRRRWPAVGRCRPWRNRARPSRHSPSGPSAPTGQCRRPAARCG